MTETMSIIRMINMEATQSERLALRCIDLVTGPMLVNPLDGEYVQEFKPDYGVSVNGVRHDEEDEGLLEQAIQILPHRDYGDK